ncbi:MAG TPA: cob(I)yrinic acid a,c-diamide adenosyltransferase [Chthoniobacterales bacterium]|jgi:cob(I)alamin adenosyltransferase
MSIVTKTGDSGETSLMYGRRVSKDNPRVEAYGCVDELTAALGFVRAGTTDKVVAEEILAVQKDLIIVMGELATSPEDLDRYSKDGFKVTTAAMVDRLTTVITEMEKDESLYPKDWVIPGNNPMSAALDIARATCRRAERQVAGVAKLNSEVLRYLNRLSDLCWILARYCEKKPAAG